VLDRQIGVRAPFRSGAVIEVLRLFADRFEREPNLEAA